MKHLGTLSSFYVKPDNNQVLCRDAEKQTDIKGEKGFLYEANFRPLDCASCRLRLNILLHFEEARTITILTE